jgi:hypothetical protein
MTSEYRHLQHLLEVACELGRDFPLISHLFSHTATTDALALLTTTEPLRGLVCPRCHFISDAAMDAQAAALRGEKGSKTSGKSSAMMLCCSSCGCIFDFNGKAPLHLKRKRTVQEVRGKPEAGEGVPTRVKRVKTQADGEEDDKPEKVVVPKEAKPSASLPLSAITSASGSILSLQGANKNAAEHVEGKVSLTALLGDDVPKTTVSVTTAPAGSSLLLGSKKEKKKAESVPAPALPKPAAQQTTGSGLLSLLDSGLGLGSKPQQKAVVAPAAAPAAMSLFAVAGTQQQKQQASGQGQAGGKPRPFSFR